MGRRFAYITGTVTTMFGEGQLGAAPTRRADGFKGLGQLPVSSGAGENHERMQIKTQCSAAQAAETATYDGFAAH